MEKINPKIQHEIQNAIVNYRGLRRKMFATLITQVEIINEIDKQMKRAEKALRGEPVKEKKTWWERLRNPFNVFQ